MIVPMRRVRFTGPSSQAFPLLSLLASLEILHLVRPGEDPVFAGRGLKAGEFSQADRETLALAQAALEAIDKALEVLSGKGRLPRRAAIPSPKGWLDRETLGEVERIASSILRAQADQETARKELWQVEFYRFMFEEFSALIQTVAESREMELTGVILTGEEGDPERDYLELEETVNRVTQGACAFARGAVREFGLPALIVSPLSLSAKVAREALGGRVKPLELPEEFRGRTFAATMRALFESEFALRGRLAQGESDLAEMASRWSAPLAMARLQIRLAIEPLLRAEYLAHSMGAFFLTGWAPAHRVDPLRLEVAKAFHGEIMVFDLPPARGEYEATPVALRNNFLARPFEPLLALYGPPVYGGLDPTPALAVTLPFLFGFILGDVGYAMALGLLAYAVARRWPSNPLARDAARVMAAFALASAAFGAVYGEFFGELGAHMGMPGPLWDRKAGATEFLAAALSLGAAHLCLGSVMGAMTAARIGRHRHAIGRAADAVLFASGLWLAFKVAGGAWDREDMAIPGAALAVKIFAGHGVEAALEIPKLAANTLSYARLMALGLASVIFADIAGKVAFGSEMIAAGAVAGALLHLMNFIIGVFGPAIQSVRLHFVEFFSYGFIHGAVVYAPLAYPPPHQSGE